MAQQCDWEDRRPQISQNVCNNHSLGIQSSASVVIYFCGKQTRLQFGWLCRDRGLTVTPKPELRVCVGPLSIQIQGWSGGTPRGHEISSGKARETREIIQLRYRRIQGHIATLDYTSTRENSRTQRRGNLGNNVERLALPSVTLVGQLLAFSGTVHPAGGMSGFGEKEAVTLRDDLEMALAGPCRRGSRRCLLLLLLEDLGSCQWCIAGKGVKRNILPGEPASWSWSRHRLYPPRPWPQPYVHERPQAVHRHIRDQSGRYLRSPSGSAS